MANKDLRDWISAVDAIGELQLVNGAEPKEEIGGIVDLCQRKMGAPAVLFDEVPGFPKGARVLANILTSVPGTSTSRSAFPRRRRKWSMCSGGGATCARPR